MAIIISHRHYLHVVFVSILVFQTFDRMIFGTLNFPGARWYMLTARDPQMVRDEKTLGNHSDVNHTNRCQNRGAKTS